MSRDARVGLAVVAALALQFAGWTAVTRDRGALLCAVAAVALVGTTGLLARRLGAPGWLAQWCQPAVLAGGTLALRAAVARDLSWSDLAAGTVEHLRASIAPVAPHPGVTVWLFLFAGVLALLADALAVGLRRPAWVVLPLLILVLIPALGPKAASFTLTNLGTFAVGLVLVLAAAGSPRFHAGPRGTEERLGATLSVALVTALALAATAILSPLAPVPPSVDGRDGEPIRMGDPSLDLKRNLTRPANVTALTYTTDKPGGAYLRLTTLPAFGPDGWHLVNSDVRTGSLPRPPGLTMPASTRRSEVRIVRLESEYLPLPYAPQRVRADERWGYLPESLTMLSLGIPDRRRATAGLSYEVTSLDVQPTDEQLAATVEGARPLEGETTVAVPEDVPQDIVDLTLRLTRDADTPGRRAQAILRYLRSPDFTYTLEPAPGTGYETLERFLLEDKEGYCEQYAASMALMARVAGIPSRVAVGFTPGREVDGRWQVSLRDMHTWPELYFSEWGWVSFEPTPAAGLGTRPSPSASPAATAQPTSTPSATDVPTAPPTSAPDPDAASGAEGTRAALVALLVGLAVAAAAAVPALVRGRRRRLRLAPGRDPSVAALDAWDEVRDTFLDHGRAWPGGSPRYAAMEAGAQLPEASRESLRRLAINAEVGLYGGPVAAVGDAPASADVTAVRDSLASGASSRERLRARLWPRSVVRR